MIPTVYVIDDEELARRSVCAVVDSMGLRHEAYSSAEEFLESYEPSQPGCLVTDIRMPGLSGLELQTKLAEERVKLPIIIISGHGNVAATVKAMKQGAITFLEKPCDSHMLFEAIREALQRDEKNRNKRSIRQDALGLLASLTQEEQQILKLIVSGKSNKVIADELDLSVRTIESRRSKIFEKTRTDAVADLVRLVLEAQLGDEL